MRNPAFCICINKDADQRAFVFATLINPISKPLAIFCDCTVRFVSDLVGDPEDRFSHNEAQVEVRPRRYHEGVY